MTTATVAAPSPILLLAAAIMAGATMATPHGRLGSERTSERPRSSFLPSSHAASATAISEESSRVLMIEHPEDALVSQVVEFGDLGAGWDGASGAKPKASSILDAVSFLQAAGTKALALDPSLHSDGTVLLEIDGGIKGVLQFSGDGLVRYAVIGKPPGRAAFSRANIPDEVLQLLNA